MRALILLLFLLPTISVGQDIGVDDTTLIKIRYEKIEAKVYLLNVYTKKSPGTSLRYIGYGGETAYLTMKVRKLDDGTWYFQAKATRDPAMWGILGIMIQWTIFENIIWQRKS